MKTKFILPFMLAAFLCCTQTNILAQTPWYIIGNTGTIYGTNFIGTTDDEGLMFQVNGNVAGRIEDNNSGNGSYKNTGIGYQSLSANTTGTDNVGIGYQALNSNQNGFNNTVAGSLALFTNVSGSLNTAYGYRALYSSVGGSNTAFGSNALINVTTDENTAVGSSALVHLSTGQGCTAVGFLAGGNVTTGIDNIALGLYAENSAVSSTITGNDNIGIGDFTFSSIGTTLSGSDNIAIGYEAGLSNTSASNNIDIGYKALYGHVTGDNNTGLGYNTLYYNASGTSNTAVGSESLYNNLGGANNAFGYQALYSTASSEASYNDAFGYQALFPVTTGSYNDAFGFQALLSNTSGSFNDAFGYQALTNNIAGNNNVALGYFAGYYTDKGDNTFVGYYAGSDNISDGGSGGNENTCLGSHTDIYAEGLTNATAIGYGVKALYSNTVKLGNTSVTELDFNGALAPSNGADTYDPGTSGYLLESNGSGNPPSWVAPGGVGTIYPTTEIPYGDGVTPGGVTSNSLTYDLATQTFTLGYPSTLGLISTSSGTSGSFFEAGDIIGNNNSTQLTLVDAYPSSISLSVPNGSIIFTPDWTVNSVSYQWPNSIGTPANAYTLTSDASGNLSWANTNLTAWALTGNSGTTYGTNFIGTTDDEGIMFQMNSGIVAGRIEDGTSANNSYYNTSVGYDALPNNTSSITDNTTMGYQAGLNTDAGDNTFIGYNAGMTNSSGGNENTCLGSGADVGSTGLSDAAAIGFGAVTPTSGWMMFGDDYIVGLATYASAGIFRTSDSRFKRNVANNVIGLDFIKKLTPVTYNFDTKALDEYLREGNENSYPDKQKLIDSKDKMICSGFIAQDVEAAAKSVGYDFNGVHVPANNKDIYMLDYSSFVVPLVKAVQELSSKSDSNDSTIAQQQQQISDLQSAKTADETQLANQQQQLTVQQSQLDQLSSLVSKLDLALSQCCTNYQSTTSSGTSLQSGSVTNDAPLLNQNIPNPFTQNTIISCYVPSVSKSASLNVYNLEGQLLKSYQIGNTGFNQITITAGTLAAGDYLYTLFVDGQKIDTKKMTLTH